jgi:hypothetical protein
MTSPTTTSAYNYDNSAQRWRDSTNGRFVSSDNVNAEMQRHQSGTYSTLDSLTRQLYAGQIDVSQWQVAVASELKDAHIAQAMFGAGGRANMGFAEFGRVGQTLREQYGFLNQFAADIAAGKVSEAQALARIKMYGNATQQSYWAEYVEENRNKKFYYRLHPAEHCSDCIARALGNPYMKDTLQGYPGDGSTKCGANDACTLEAEE